MTSSIQSRMTPELAARFEREALPYQGQLMRAALQLTRHRQDAEDLVQDAITRAYTGYHSFAPGTNLKAWLHRILLNTFINGYRKRERDPFLSLLPAERLPAKSMQSAEDSVLSLMPTARLVRALHELPVDFRRVIYLVDVEGFSYQEVTAIMNIPLGTVMSRLHRARTRLRNRLTSPNGELFEVRERGERVGNRSQEVPHVQRDNGDNHRACNTRDHLDHCHRNDRSTPSAAATIWS